MATRRFKGRGMKFGVPLSVPGSRYVERCQGMPSPHCAYCESSSAAAVEAHAG